MCFILKPFESNQVHRRRLFANISTHVENVMFSLIPLSQATKEQHKYFRNNIKTNCV